MANAALLVIDLQRGAFDGVRVPPIDAADALIGSARQLLAAARSSGVPVVFVQHCAEEGDAFEEDSIHGELHEGLARQPGEPVVRKHESSSFEGTDLASILQGMNAKALYLCGLQSEFCVSNTARSALADGYAVTIAEDGHGTWPSNGMTSEAIRAQANATLASLGARVMPVAMLVETMRL